MFRPLLVAALLGAAGCGRPPPAPAAAPKISWPAFQKLAPEDQADPYVLHNLDDDARARLAEQAKKGRAKK